MSSHRDSDSRLSQRGFLIKPTVNQIMSYSSCIFNNLSHSHLFNPAKLFPTRAGHAEGRRNRRSRRGRGGGDGVVLEEVEDDDDVPVTLDEADEEDEVDDLA